MSRHWFAVVTVGLVCFAAAPAPAPDRRPVVPPDARPVALDGCLPSNDEMAGLAAADPVAMLDACRTRYRRDVRGFEATLVKRERVNGALHPEEVVAVAVREVPYAVLMRWESGRRSVLGTPVEASLYAAGENHGKMVVWRPSALIPRLREYAVPPTDPQARSASRYAITEAGLGQAIERTFRAWADARDRGGPTPTYLGTKPVPEAGGRECHVLQRVSDPPTVDAFSLSEPPPNAATRAADAATFITVMIDAETWLQVGSKLERADGGLIGSYYFRDVVLNPHFPPGRFTPAAFR